jgi:hypothetical protein
VKLLIEADGTITALYRDELLGLGRVLSVSRASHVEWNLSGWYVRLSDDLRNGADAGKVIGQGFRTRAEALAHEVQWLEKNKL